MRTMVLAVAAAAVVASLGGTAYAVHGSEAASANAARTKAECVSVKAELAPFTKASTAAAAAWRSARQHGDGSSTPVLLADMTQHRALLAEQQWVVDHPQCYRAVDVEVAQGDVAGAKMRISLDEGRLK